MDEHERGTESEGWLYQDTLNFCLSSRKNEILLWNLIKNRATSRMGRFWDPTTPGSKVYDSAPLITYRLESSTSTREANDLEDEPGTCGELGHKGIVKLFQDWGKWPKFWEWVKAPCLWENDPKALMKIKNDLHLTAKEGKQCPQTKLL